MMKREGLELILGIQILFLSSIALGYPCFIANLLASQGLELACITIGNAIISKNLPRPKLKDKYKNSLYILLLTIALPLYYGHSLLKEEFLVLWVACAVVRYLELKGQPATITYGEALACSFAEGFLFQVVPPGGEWVRKNKFMKSDDYDHKAVLLEKSMKKLYMSQYGPLAKLWDKQDYNSYDGLEAAITDAAASRRALFPLKRLLVVFPRSLYCPRSLDAFNSRDERLPHLELCNSLPEIRRDVAGVRDRVYRNTVYKVRRHAADPRPAHVVTATPINTLWMVLQKRSVYYPMASADAEEIAAAFCATLPSIIRNSAELRDKCDLVYYDDTDPNGNLAETLLDKIREIEPNYDTISTEQ